jgi:predicted metal-binding membrane protein
VSAAARPLPVRCPNAGAMAAWFGRLSARPALVAELGIGAAWVAQLASLIEDLRPGGSSAMVWWCTAGAAMPSAHARVPGAALTLAAAPAWTLMSVAMMTPAALPAVRHVAANSLRWRRRRATVEFLGVYLAMWTLYGLALLSMLALVRPVGTRSLVLALALACGWQLTSSKRRALSACHRSSPLPLRGWPATAGVARFALRHGGACVGSCWALMLVMAVAMSVEPPMLLGLTGLIYVERCSVRPRRVTRRVALALAASATALLLTFG